MAEYEQGSPAVGNSTTYKKQTITMIFAVMLIAAAVLCVVFFCLRVNADARVALREAKDVNVALKMKAIEKYGLGGTVNSSTSMNGMSKGVEEEVLAMAHADGKITLQSWDEEAREPLAFTYQKDKFIILYNKDEEGHVSWTGYYTFKVIGYSDQ